MKVITKSGKTYRFYVEGGRFVFDNGWEKGVVLTLAGVEVGEHMILTYLRVRNGMIDEDSRYIETSRVTAITA